MSPQSHLRKAPQAPRHFKSPFACFSSVHKANVKNELGSKASASDISSYLGNMWRKLSSVERAIWDDVAKKDKERYLREKVTYKGPWKVKSKQIKKHPNAPKRPMSAFLFYSRKLRSELKAKYPNKRNTEISKMLGEMWRNVPGHVRAKYVKKEAEERQKYKMNLEKFNSEQLKEESCKDVQETHSKLFCDSVEQVAVEQNPDVFDRLFFDQWEDGGFDNEGTEKHETDKSLPTHSFSAMPYENDNIFGTIQLTTKYPPMSPIRSDINDIDMIFQTAV